jgi:hypothetical protein
MPAEEARVRHSSIFCDHALSTQGNWGNIAGGMILRLYRPSVHKRKDRLHLQWRHDYKDVQRYLTNVRAGPLR